MTSPVCSVIIPTYNAENHIEQALDSCLTSLPKRHEIIVVDDCSRDRTLKVVAKWTKRHDHPVTMLHTGRSGGPSVARNLGMDIALGNYLVFLDADDLLAPGAVTQAIGEMLSYRLDCYCGAWCNFENTLKYPPQLMTPRELDEWAEHDAISSCLNIPPVVSSFIIRNTSIRWKQTLIAGEIYDFFFRYLTRHPKIKRTRDPLTYIRQHTSQYRISNVYDIHDPFLTINLYKTCTKRLIDTGLMTPTRLRIMRLKFQSQMYRARIVNRKRFLKALPASNEDPLHQPPSKAGGLSKLTNMVGYKAGVEVHYHVNRLLGRLPHV